MPPGRIWVLISSPRPDPPCAGSPVTLSQNGRRDGKADNVPNQAAGSDGKPSGERGRQATGEGTLWLKWHYLNDGAIGDPTMGRYLLLWLLGIPIPILILI